MYQKKKTTTRCFQLHYNSFCFILIAVQHERGPRNSTLRRQQLAFFYNDTRLPNSSGVLDLAMVKSMETSPTRMEISPHITAAPFLLNPAMSPIRVSVNSRFSFLCISFCFYVKSNSFVLRLFAVSIIDNWITTVSFITGIGYGNNM